ncbi:MAG TPA: adenylate/guanylate cyclase domain-containing protein [Steroidobacteraceae bacterium]|jgi:adenylate cyclase|nr:adenylate/guanylate cyclase domain-containing protein [Steroidobacteraceae bacterium]
MKWWVRARLRTKIFIAFSSLIIAVLLATFSFTQFVVSREVKGTLDRQLLTTGEVFEALLKERGARLQTNSILLASDFALKSAVATHFDPSTYEPATLASAAQSWQERIGVDLFWITDELGTVLVASSQKDRSGEELEALSPLREAIDSEEPAAGIAEIDGQLFQLVAVPVFAPDVIGFLLLGEAIDDRFAARLKGSTGTDVSFLTQDRVFASSWATDKRGRVIPSPTARTALLRTKTRMTSPFSAEDETFLSLIVPVQANLPQPLFALMQRSYDEALAPLRTLQKRIVIIGTAGLLGALLIGVALAGGIIAPLQSLVSGMREVLRGNLQYRSQIERGDELGFIAKSFNEMIDGLEERELIRDTFGRFVSHDVAEAVLTGRVPLQGERRDVSILFQDIRGFTSLSERLDPAVMLRLLNQFFTEVVAAVEAEGGVVKQFLGDGVMALFGAPQPYPDHPERAVRAALGIVSRLKGLNESLQEQGIGPLEIGVGIHTGAVVAGLIGPDNRIEYGVVGDAVNLAARVEALTREMQATILVSRDVAAQLGPAFNLGQTASMLVKGKSQPVEVVEVCSLCQPIDSSPAA